VGTGWRRRRGRRRLRCRWAGRWRLRPRPRNEGPTWTTRHPTGSYISRAAPASHRRTNRGEQSLPQWKCPAGNRTRRTLARLRTAEDDLAAVRSSLRRM